MSVTAEDNVEFFREQYPDHLKWMEEAAKGFDFAASVLESVKKYGTLTERQMDAVERCMTRDHDRAEMNATRVLQAPTVEVAPIEEAFIRAKKSGVKAPKLTIERVTFKPAKAGSANEGALYVTREETYLGKIKEGRFFGSRECRPLDQVLVLEILQNPRQAAIAHGKLSGRCAICSRELTDANSVEAGIGPICAEKFGW